MSNDTTPIFTEADLVYSITRADLIEAGELVDVTECAAQNGLRIPVALTRAVWLGCVEWDDEDSARQVHQDQIARLNDVLWMARVGAAANREGSQFLFQVLRVPRDGKKRTPKVVQLRCVIGPGDAGEPVITILEPQED